MSEEPFGPSGYELNVKHSRNLNREWQNVAAELKRVTPIIADMTDADVMDLWGQYLTTLSPQWRSWREKFGVEKVRINKPFLQWFAAMTPVERGTL